MSRMSSLGWEKDKGDDAAAGDDDEPNATPFERFRALCVERRVVLCGVSGKVGSGKTTLCEALAADERFAGRRTLTRNFADRLKEAVAAHLDLDVALCYSQAGKNASLPLYSMTLGEMLQRYGTALRGVHPAMWVNAVQSWIEARLLADDADDDDDDADDARRRLVLIGDVRFPNELEWLHACGGCVVRLEGDPAGVRAASRRDLEHVSETALDAHAAHFDVVIDTNRLDVEHTRDEVARALLGWSAAATARRTLGGEADAKKPRFHD